MAKQSFQQVGKTRMGDFFIAQLRAAATLLLGLYNTIYYLLYINVISH